MKLVVFNYQLDPLKQWYCDGCGGVIEQAEDGMLEWLSYEIGGYSTFRYSDFRIVHGNWVRACTKIRYDDEHLSDGHLTWFLGSDGLNKLMTMLLTKQLDKKELVMIIRRLHQKYFEEARTYIACARNEGNDEIDTYDYGDLTESEAIELIRMYSKMEL